MRNGALGARGVEELRGRSTINDQHSQLQTCKSKNAQKLKKKKEERRPPEGEFCQKDEEFAKKRGKGEKPIYFFSVLYDANNPNFPLFHHLLRILCFPFPPSSSSIL